MRERSLRRWLVPDVASLNPSYAFWVRLGHAFRLSRHIATARQQTGNRNILVEFFPMQAGTAQFDALSLRWCRAKETGKPRQRHAQRAAVRQIDPHRVFVKADGRW
jgi:hypothetical protein